MVYSSSEHQFVGAMAISKEEKTTPWWLIREAVDDFSNGQSSSVDCSIECRFEHYLDISTLSL